jgi:aryl-alcohol dehydrogenase-like predicted oxidoreductase
MALMKPETTTIPGIPIPVSRVALGTWAIGGWMWGGTDDQQSIDTIRRAVDLGINLIDTAPVYGFGRSEELVGQALEGIRDRVAIATKVGIAWSGGHLQRDASAMRIRDEIESSLRRLRTDRIDLYQVHWPDPLVPAEETARELDRLRAQGKILAIGVSNYSVAEMEAFRAFTSLASVQSPYNLFEREIERDVLPYARARGIRVLGYGALCRGLLTGRMRPDTTFRGDDLRTTDPKFRPPRYSQYLAAVDALSRFAAERHGTSVLALAARWVVQQDTIALWGARRPDQLDAIGDVFGWTLGRDDLATIDALIARYVTDPVGPEFMAPPVRASSAASVSAANVS